VQNLKAGRTYLILGSLLVTSANDGDFIIAELYNVTAGAAFARSRMQGWRTDDATFSDHVYPFAAHVFTPSVDTTISMRMEAGGSATADVDHLGTVLVVAELGPQPTDWVHVDTIDFAGDTYYEFSSTGDGVQQHDVDGNADLRFKIEFDIVGDPTNGCVAQVELNGVTTNQSSRYQFWGTSSGSGTESFLGRIASDSSGNSQASGEWVMHGAATGARRRAQSEFISEDGGTDLNKFEYAGVFNDPSTNITAIGLRATVGDFQSGQARLFIRGAQF
jgi:hypothetical protein